MPELPEVETVKRGLEPAMNGKVFARVILNRPDLRNEITPGFADRVTGARLTALIRRGKYIIALLDNTYGFVLHLGMSGRVNIYGPHQTYVPVKHDHVLFEMDDGHVIVFNDPRRFGMLYLVQADHWEEELPFSAMGPEPLSNHFHGQALYDALQKRKTPIKTALLDQKVVSGVGNIYACEALYDAGIHPELASNDLSLEECERLAPAIKDVLQRAIQAGGSTLKDYQKTDGSLGYFQHSFSVYDREGAPCTDSSCCCAATGGVVRIVQAGRSTFYCPHKQKNTNIKKQSKYA